MMAHSGQTQQPTSLINMKPVVKIKEVPVGARIQQSPGRDELVVLAAPHLDKYKVKLAVRAVQLSHRKEFDESLDVDFIKYDDEIIWASYEQDTLITRANEKLPPAADAPEAPQAIKEPRVIKASDLPGAAKVRITIGCMIAGMILQNVVVSLWHSFQR